MSSQFSFTWLIDRILSGATTPGQSRPGSEGNAGVLRIPPKLQLSRNHAIGLFSVISRKIDDGGVLPLCREAVSVFYSPRRF